MTEEIKTETVKVETPKRENPLLKRSSKFPGDTFRLPSKGLIYTNGEIDDEVKDGEVVVFPMTTLDEIYMRTPDMLLQGTAIDFVIKRCVPQIHKPLQLCANDIDFLLTCLRKVSYGDFITIKHTCSKCDEKVAKPHEYDIPLSFFIQNSKEFTIDDMDSMKMILSTKEHIILRASTFQEMMDLMQVNENDMKTPEDMNKLIISTLSSTIKTVDGETDKEFIKEWLSILPAQIITEFSTKLESLNRWGPKFDYSITCQDCGKDDKLRTVLNPLYFFMLPLSRKTDKKSGQ